MPALLDRNAGRPARLTQWSIGLQREVTRNLVVEASYVANRGTWWTANSLNPQRSEPGSLAIHARFNDFSSASEALLLTRNVSALTTRSTVYVGSSRHHRHSLFELPDKSDGSSIFADYPQYSDVTGFVTTRNNVTGAP